MVKLKEKFLYREIDGKMITNIKLNNFNNLPLSNNLEINSPAKVTYKININSMVHFQYYLYNIFYHRK